MADQSLPLSTAILPKLNLRHARRKHVWVGPSAFLYRRTYGLSLLLLLSTWHSQTRAFAPHEVRLLSTTSASTAPPLHPNERIDGYRTALHLESVFSGGGTGREPETRTSNNIRKATTTHDENRNPQQLVEEDLIVLAQRVIRADLGIADPSLLDDERFRWISNTVDQPLSKTDYVAAGRFFNLRGAFPDLEYRAHDFRVMDGTVRCTCRINGTMRGELRLRDEVLPPTGNTMQCPPEGVSIDIDPVTGKVTKICSGFCLDRCVGNTKGLTGVQAASVIAGKDISALENLPVTTVLYSIVARPAKNVSEESNDFVAPFPATVMIQLAKGVLITKMAYDDPTLLSEDFEYITPFAGPIRKEAFLKSYAAEELSGYYPNFRNFRVDVYEPKRVWIDLQPTAEGYVGHPQCMSLTFDDDGYCTRVTSSAVLDPSIGNAGGLGGPEGLRYARGDASAGVSARPLPRVFGRLRKRAFSTLTGVGVDEYQPTNNGVSRSKRKITPEPPTERPRTPPVASKVAIGRSDARQPMGHSPQKASPPSRKVMTSPPPKATSTASKPKAVPKSARRAPKPPTTPLKKTNMQIRDRPQTSQITENKDVVKRLEQLKDMTESIRILPVQLSRSFSLLPTTLSTKPTEPTRGDAKRIIKDRLSSIKKNQSAKLGGVEGSFNAKSILKRNGEADPKDAQAKKLMLARKIQAERREKMAESDRERLLKLARQRRDEARGIKSPEAASVHGSAKMGSSSTFSLFRTEATSPFTAKQATAPRGVPTLNRWRRNSDNSVSGLVRGSKTFDDGSRVTTSAITGGTIASGEVVRTGSGSRYFLE